LFVDGIRSKLCELVEVKRVFCLFQRIVDASCSISKFSNQECKFLQLEDSSKYSGGDTVFPMRIGDFLCVFGVPKKRHIQRKRFGLRTSGTIRV